MKTNFSNADQFAGRRPFKRLALLGILILALGHGWLLRADILREPPNVVFGTITISNVVAGPERADLVIEARRTPAGAPLASYRMGEVADYGSTYALDIPIETATGTNQAAIALGSTLYLVLRDEVSVLAQVPFQILERGKFQQVNFVIGNAVDSNGLPDAWELAKFGNAAQDPLADPDRDGRNNLQEFLAGTNPLVADQPDLKVAFNGAQVLVSFFARKAEGAGYEGKARYFSLEGTANLGTGTWQPMANFTNIFGNNQTVVYVIPGTNALPAIFRYKAELKVP